jgi:hypothetical protein
MLESIYLLIYRPVAVSINLLLFVSLAAYIQYSSSSTTLYALNHCIFYIRTYVELTKSCVHHAPDDDPKQGSKHIASATNITKCWHISVYFVVLSDILLCRLSLLYIPYILYTTHNIMLTVKMRIFKFHTIIFILSALRTSNLIKLFKSVAYFRIWNMRTDTQTDLPQCVHLMQRAYNMVENTL